MTTNTVDFSRFFQSSLQLNNLTLVSGKSNLVDAIAFALCAPFAKGKHSHVRDLVYQIQPGSEASIAEGLERMYVQLNLKENISLKRSYLIKD